MVGYRVRGGGHGFVCQVWNSGRWLIPNDDGPGGPEIMAAAPVSPEALLQAGVDCFPLPENYDPGACEIEEDCHTGQKASTEEDRS